MSKQTKSDLEIENEAMNEEVQTPEEVSPQAEQEIDYKDKYTRLLAEYSNFAKQKEVELQATAKFANKNMISKVLDILDDIETGIVQDQVSEETKNLLEILKAKILQLLAYEGVIELEVKVGDPYDAVHCEVVTTIDDTENSGKIIQILRKGYTISDKVLRTAKVIVGK